MIISFTSGEKSVSDMPPTDQRNLYRDALEAVKRFYQNPQNLSAYKQWQAEQSRLSDGKSV